MKAKFFTTVCYLCAFVCLESSGDFSAQQLADNLCTEGYSRVVHREHSDYRYYHVNGNRNNRVTFGYEIELFAEASPNLVILYRLPKYSQEQWNRIPVERRRVLLDAAIKKAKKHDVVMVRLDTAPKFLALEVIKDTSDSDRLELSDNAITTSLWEVQRQFQFIGVLFKIAGVHVHVVYNAKGAKIKGAAQFAKLDFDLTQTETLAKGYESYLKTGRTPGKNVAHWSTGLMDATTLQRYEKAVEKPRGTETTDTLLKYIYGITFRSELYGKGKVGNEARNAIRRLNQALEKMKETAENLETGFADYRRLEFKNDNVILREETWEQLSSHHKALFEALGKHLDAKHAGQTRGGAPFALRFAYPLLEWTNHPYIRQLRPELRREFLAKLSNATAEYLKTTKAISRKDLPAEKKLTKVQIAMAKWAFDSKVSDWLKAGKTAFKALGPPAITN